MVFEYDTGFTVTFAGSSLISAVYTVLRNNFTVLEMLMFIWEMLQSY